MRKRVENIFSLLNRGLNYGVGESGAGADMQYNGEHVSLDDISIGVGVHHRMYAAFCHGDGADAECEHHSLDNTA
jgi:hypothetical protein